MPEKFTLPRSLSISCNAEVGSLHMDVELRDLPAWTVLFGPSGSGKSSLLRLMAGLWRPAGAHVLLDGDDLAPLLPHKRGCGFVAQAVTLFPHMTVRENMLAGCRSYPGSVDWLDEIIGDLRIDRLLPRPVASLSGGEGQLVALARCLASAPRFILLDELFSGMPQLQRSEWTSAVRTYAARLRAPVVSVTHDIAEALTTGDAVIRLDHGRAVARGPASEVLAPERAWLRTQIEL